MKTHLILLFQILFIQVYSQSNFISENKLWSDVQYNSTFRYPFETKYVKFSGDTILKEMVYKKVLKCEDAEMQDWELIGFIRETDTATVYFWKKWFEDEELLYDFGIEEGDTLLSYYGSVLVVDSIRSIPFGIYQEPRNHYYISKTSRDKIYEIWIDGVGGSDGVLYNLESTFEVGEYRELLCFTENDSLKYLNENYNTCYYNTVGIEEHSGDLIGVEYYPGKIEISTPLSLLSNSHFRLFDLSGRQVFERILNTDESIILDVSEFSSGVYIFQISNPDFIVSDKILIN